LERHAVKLPTDYKMPSLSSGWSGPSALSFDHSMDFTGIT
jgi:hypothetical protein